MPSQLSTAFSDLVLALSCLYCVRQLTGYSQAKGINFNYANSGFMLIFTAAGLGVVKFGMSSPPEILVKCHKYASYLASVVGLCSLAAEFYEQAKFPGYSQLHLYASVTVIFLQLMLDPKAHNTIADFVKASAVFSVLLICSLYKIVYGCIGAVLVALLGTIVGTEGSRFGILAVDLFHYGFVVVNYCFTQALMRNA